MGEEPEVVPARTSYDRWAEVYDNEDNPLVLLEEKHNGLLKWPRLAVAG